MKKYFFLSAAAVLALASCTSDEFMGDKNKLDASKNSPITLGAGTGVVTRADQDHATSAASLDNNFIVYGWKTTGTTEQVVFDHYNVNYVASSANSTESNSMDWEYVNQSRDIKVSASGTAYKLGSLDATATQDIKYWDFSATKYDFVAFSLGKGVEVSPATNPKTYNYAVATAVNKSNLTSAAYTLAGTVDQLAACYIADKVTVDNVAGHKSNAVQFKFRSLGAKIRIGMYETIPSYSVKDVVFYTADNTQLSGVNNVPTLYASSGIYPDKTKSGTMTVTFPHPTVETPANSDYNKAHVSFSQTGNDLANSSTVSTGALTMVAKERFEKNAAGTAVETGSIFLGRSSNAASLPTSYTTVLPYEAGAELTLKVDYTLVSRDGSGETIKVTGATAKIPAVYTKWQANYAYTYIFKISDNTNGSTGTGTDPAGLYPITFDAVVTADEDGVQETITTIASPSITTYAKGEMVTANNEYLTGANIYVKVDGATLALTPTANCALYTATVETGAAQEITEESVANAIANGTYDSSAKTYTVTDANSNTLVVTEDASGLSIATEIAATDAPDGNAVSGNFAKFTPSAAGTYVFEYTDNASPAVKHYKVIKVVAAPTPAP